MLQQLLDFVQEQKLFQPSDRLLLAVSGGIDSMVLWHLFHKAGFQFAVAHCNFQLRGEESDEDESFVAQVASNRQNKLYSQSFETGQHASQNKISVQMAARDLRRAWFAELIQKHKYQKIATAHHLNDSLESVILNLTRGTGLAGFQGILPVVEDYVRPLMFATQSMVEQYAVENKVRWREDRSNSSTKYRRNHIRHDVIPVLKQMNPGLEETFATTAAKMIGAIRIYENTLKKHKKEIVQIDDTLIKIEKKKLSALDAPQLILFEVIKEYGFNYSQAGDILRSIDHQPGKVFNSASHQITIDRDCLFLNEVANEPLSEYWIEADMQHLQAGSLKLTFDRIETAVTPVRAGADVAFLDLDKLVFPLKLRRWHHGDVFYPLGMNHRKKVSDFMIDRKIPVNLKKQTMTIFSGEDLIWVVGHRIDERYRITTKTRKVFRIHCQTP
jgi:tRNA(Ile)-lysidine synthase